ncbi:MAG: hypothetical protein NZM65_09915, partial [Flavobacteriales bacterium]|nr:hypothetical protein [Flavobacteriales bacterium]MDW8410987.1 glycerol-3-phosphate dehydrogenase C-terminal domain-containing protein [Flavobacteriales bacterium]
WKDMVRGWAAQLPDGPDRSEEIAENYGRAAEKIVQRAYEIYQNDRSHGSPLLQAEVEWTIQEEWAWKPEDYFVRRSGKAYFNSESQAKEESFVNNLFRKFILY